jgi:hypothetical protein
MLFNEIDKSPPVKIEKASRIADLFAMGRSIFTGKEVKIVCTHYLLTPDKGLRNSFYVAKFVKSACLPFASAQVKNQLASLPDPDTRSTLSRYMNILTADGAFTRLRGRYEAHPEALFFVGETVPCSRNAFTPEKNDWPNPIPDELTQSALEILRRHNNHVSSFSSQEIHFLYKYTDEVSSRGADMWLNLAVFFRDAAHPFASTSLCVKHGSFSETDDTAMIVNQYYDLVLDEAVKRLLLIDSGIGHSQVQVKADNKPHGDMSPDSTSERTGVCCPGKEVEEQGKANGMPHDDTVSENANERELDFSSVQDAQEQQLKSATTQSPTRLPISEPSTVNYASRYCIPLSGKVTPQGVALPSLIQGKRLKGTRSIYSTISPRQIRDVIRQYSSADAMTRMQLRNNTGVFYTGGSRAFQIRPEYFWVLIQEVDEDEPPVTDAHKDTMFPEWRLALSWPSVQKDSYPISPIQQHTPTVEDCSSPTETNEFLQRIGLKLDSLMNQATNNTKLVQRAELKINHLTDQVADLLVENATLKISLDELTGQVKEFEVMSCRSQREEHTECVESGVDLQRSPMKRASPYGKGQALPAETNGIHSECLDEPCREGNAEETTEADDSIKPRRRSSSRNKLPVLSEGDSIDESVVEPIAKRLRRLCQDDRRRSARAVTLKK